MKRNVSSIAMVLLYCSAWAQPWDLVGNPGVTNTSKLGSTNAAPVSFYTNDVMRTRLFNSSSATIGSFNGINQAGYLGVGRNATTFPVGAYSRLHLGDLNQSTWQGGSVHWM
jgi:hypothetical protein